MCNVWCKTFVGTTLPDWPSSPEVLEVGSRNVNGSPREFCEPRAARYVGCDLEMGEGVDVIADATRLTTVFPPESFDVVISTEMMEHVPDWPAAWSELMSVLRPGGLLILSTRSLGFPLHDYPGDFWRFSQDDIRGILQGVGDVLRICDDDTMGYPCGVGVVARKLPGVDLQAWRRRLTTEVPLYNMHACVWLTQEAFAAGIPSTGELEPLRKHIMDLEQKVFDAQIAVLNSGANLLAMQGSLEAWHNSVYGQLSKAVDYVWQWACVPFRFSRYLYNPILRGRLLNNLERRWLSRFGGHRIKNLPDLDWLLQKLELNVTPEQVMALLGSYLTCREESGYRKMIGQLRAAGEGKPSSVNRPAALSTGVKAPVGRKRILFICGEFPDPVHGGGGRVSDFIKALSAEHDVYVAAWYDRPRDHKVFVELGPFCRGLRGFSYEDMEGGCVGKLLDFIGNQPVDFVHYEWPRSLNNFDRRLGRHHIFTHMEVVSCSLWMDLRRMTPLSPEWLTRFAQLCNMLKVEVVDAARVDCQIVVTAKDGEFLSRFVAGHSYYVVNHGITRSEFEMAEHAPDPHTLVFTGNFSHYPNVNAAHYFMRDIRPAILAAVPDLHVWLVGAHPPADVRQYHDGSGVFVTGYVPDVRPFIQKASVCIAPLVSGAGLRTKVVQYAALRRPCVATSIAVEDLVFEDQKEVCIADQPDVFAARVIELLRDPSLAAGIAARARKCAMECYDNRQIAKKDLGILYGLLEKGKERL